jgi:hypothetical protein
MFKIVLDLDRLKGKQRKALIDAGYFVGDTRFWDSGCGEQLENHVVLVNYGQTVVMSAEPKLYWDGTFVHKNGFEEKWISNFDTFLSNAPVDTNDKEFEEEVKRIIKENE